MKCTEDITIATECLEYKLPFFLFQGKLFRTGQWKPVCYPWGQVYAMHDRGFSGFQRLLHINNICFANRIIMQT